MDIKTELTILRQNLITAEYEKTESLYKLRDTIDRIINVIKSSPGSAGSAWISEFNVKIKRLATYKSNASEKTKGLLFEETRVHMIKELDDILRRYSH